MTQGVQRQVINIGLGMKQILVEPRGTSFAAYLGSLSHKVGRLSQWKHVTLTGTIS